MKVSEKCLYLENIPLRIYSPTEIVDYSEVQDGEARSVYILTSGGDVYKVDVKQAHAGQRSRSREPSCTVNQNVDNESIFDELLETTEPDNDISVHFTSLPVYIIHPKDRILNVPEKVLNICVTPDHIVIATETDIDYIAWLYRTNGLKNADTCSSVQPAATESRKMALLSKHMQNSVIDCSRTAMDSKHPSILKIISCDVLMKENQFTSPDVLIISSSLFKQLFGEELALLETPVALFTTPDGSIHNIPLAYFKDSNTQHTELLNMHKVNSNSRWIQMHQMSSSISHIFAIWPQYEAGCESVTMVTADKPTSPCLGLCGYDGTVTIYSDDQDSFIPKMSTLSLPEPVIAVCCHGNKLYQSTGHCLYEMTVVKCATSDLDSQMHLKISQTKVIDAQGVVAISVKSESRYIKTLEAPCTLVCVLANKELREIKVAEQDGSRQKSSPDSIQNILQSMEDLNRKAQSIALQQDQVAGYLQQLNMAAVLLHQHIQGRDLDTQSFDLDPEMGTNSFIRCKCKVSGSVLNYRRNYVDIECELLNFLPHDLTQEWCVQVCAIQNCDILERYSIGDSLAPSHTCDGHPSSPTVYTETINLANGWRRNDRLSMVIRVHEQCILVGCQLIVKIVLNAASFLPYKVDQKCLSIPLYQEDIGVLHAVAETKYTSAPRHMHTLADELKSIKRSRSTSQASTGTSQGTNNTKEVLLTDSQLPCIKKVVCIRDDVQSGMKMKDIGTDSLLQFLIPHLKSTSASCKDELTVFGQPVYVTVTELSRGATHGDVELPRGATRSISETSGGSTWCGEEIPRETTRASEEMQRSSVTLEVTVRCRRQLAPAVHVALSRKIESLTRCQKCVIPLTTKGANAYLKQLEVIIENLQELSSRKLTAIEMASSACRIYEKLRTLNHDCVIDD